MKSYSLRAVVSENGIARYYVEGSDFRWKRISEKDFYDLESSAYRSDCFSNFSEKGKKYFNKTVYV